MKEERPRSNFGSTVRSYREKLGISMTDLGRDIDIDQGLLSKIERGLRPPPEIVPYVQRMAKRFGLEPNSAEYSELMRMAYRERFPQPTGGVSEILTLSLPDSPLFARRSRGLGGLPPEDAHPDSPAGQYFSSQGDPIRRNWQRPSEAEVPPTDPSFGRSLPSALAGWDVAKVQGWMFGVISSMGAVVTKLEQGEQTLRIELRLADGSEYEAVVRSKTQKEGKAEDPSDPDS